MTDWIDNAAKELASHYSWGIGRDDYVTDEQRTNVANNYAKIIRNYQPVPPRCDSCAHWTEMPSYWGRCKQLVITTPPDFGCVQWRAHA